MWEQPAPDRYPRPASKALVARSAETKLGSAKISNDGPNIYNVVRQWPARAMVFSPDDEARLQRWLGRP